MLCIKVFPSNVVLKAMLCSVLFVGYATSYAQLDSIHWLPPLTAGSVASNAGAYEHSVYLSTPETTPFDVTVTTGTGTLIGTYSISNSSPYRLDLADGFNYLCMEPDSVGTVQQDDGLVFSANQGFYVNYRARSNAQGGSLTAKGRIARGTSFYWGGVPMIGNNNTMNAVMGVMAMEDGTTVTIDGFDPNCAFRLGSNVTGITSNTITVNLDEGETFVLEALNLVVAEHLDGWLGARITADREIVMNNGNLMGGVISGSGARDICFDQTLPTSRLGTGHITLRGNGIDATELVIVVATVDGTTLSINGGSPIATLDEGDYHLLDGSNYSAQNNMYVETSNPAYVYQVLAGSTNERTIGLNFIPPLNCLLPLAVDNISNIDMIRTTSYNGGATILTRTGATVTINGVAPSSSPQVVPGNSDWVTYTETGLSGNVSIVSDEPMAAGMFGASGDAGFAGYFSGFSERPTPVITADDVCVPATITLSNTADNIQWHFDGSQMTGETAQTLNADNEGFYFTTAGTGTCLDTSNEISFTCNILPVELADFRFECFEKTGTLHWHTLTEYNNHFFTIAGSNDGVSFYPIHKEDGQGTTETSTFYEFELNEHMHYAFYRLSQTDFDGRTEEFQSISRKKCDADNSYWFVDNNALRLSQGAFRELIIYNPVGKKILHETHENSSVRIPDSGVLILHHKNEFGIWKSQRVVVP